MNFEITLVFLMVYKHVRAYRERPGMGVMKAGNLKRCDEVQWERELSAGLR